MTIAVIDYGMGNSRSVVNAVESLKRPCRLVQDPAALSDAQGIILPGVGSFGEGMHRLRERRFLDALRREVLEKGRPFLGICLGMQLLATRGSEHGTHEGFNWIPGVADRLPAAPDLRIPHVGWNDVRIVGGQSLYGGMGGTRTFYFVHSYVLVPNDPGVVTGLCRYGGEFAASIEWNNICGTQFHPEKSHRDGLAVLENWCRKC